MTLTTALEKIRDEVKIPADFSSHRLEYAKDENARLAPTIEKLLRVIEMQAETLDWIGTRNFGPLSISGEARKTQAAVIKILEG